SGRRQDGNRRELPGRVVLRLRPAARDLRLGRLPPPGDPADRGRGLRRAVRGDDPGVDLAQLHDRGAAGSAGADLRGAVRERDADLRLVRAVADLHDLLYDDPDAAATVPAACPAACFHAEAAAARSAAPTAAGRASPAAASPAA